jgi:hypothetical protein
MCYIDINAHITYKFLSEFIQVDSIVSILSSKVLDIVLIMTM